MNTAFGGTKVGSISSSYIVFALASLELDDRDQVAASKCRDVLDEAIVQWAKDRRRSDAVAEMIAQESAELAARLQPWHVAVKVQTVNARGGQRHVVAQYGGDAGGRHRRRLPTGMDWTTSMVPPQHLVSYSSV
jgi:hypothetical protein